MKIDTLIGAADPLSLLPDGYYAATTKDEGKPIPKGAMTYIHKNTYLGAYHDSWIGRPMELIEGTTTYLPRKANEQDKD